MKYTTIVRLGLVAAGLLASACVTTVKGGSPPQERIESDWVLPSSSLRDDIEQLAEMHEHTRAQLAETQERLDFAERLLTAGRASQENRSE